VSLVLIVSALGIALRQRHEAKLAQARAEERFKDVRQLAHTLIFKIHDAVEPLPGSTPVRQTIVNEALASRPHPASQPVVVLVNVDRLLANAFVVQGDRPAGPSLRVRP